jgi:alcohol dehydrogenase class IV
MVSSDAYYATWQRALFLNMSGQRISFVADRYELNRKLTSIVLGVKKLYVVHGRGSYVNCGAGDVVKDLCTANQIALCEFDEFTQNPKRSDVEKGVKALEEFHPDLMMAVGGGSAMDMVKLIRYYSGKSVRLIALPTTAGTGAESTQFAVCYIEGVKHSINNTTILPDEAILYPPFTFGNGRYLTACTGFDALAQAIEAYWNIHATDESDGYALKAIGLIYGLLPKSKLTEKDRKDLLLGANFAGRAINITRTTVPHALSYTLTSKYGYPHGHAVALTFPFFVRYYMEGNSSRYNGRDYERHVMKMKKLAHLLGIKDSSDAVMREYISRLGLGFDTERDFDEAVVARGINLERASNSPMVITDDVLMAAVKSIRTLID